MFKLDDMLESISNIQWIVVSDGECEMIMCWNAFNVNSLLEISEGKGGFPLGAFESCRSYTSVVA